MSDWKGIVSDAPVSAGYGDLDSIRFLVSKLSPTDGALQAFGELARQEIDSRLATRFTMPIVLVGGKWPDPLPAIWSMLAAGLYHTEKFSTNTVGGPSAFGAELMATARRLLENIINDNLVLAGQTQVGDCAKVRNLAAAQYSPDTLRETQTLPDIESQVRGLR